MGEVYLGGTRGLGPFEVFEELCRPPFRGSGSKGMRLRLRMVVCLGLLLMQVSLEHGGRRGSFEHSSIVGCPQEGNS